MKKYSMNKFAPIILALSSAFLTQAVQAKYVYIRFQYAPKIVSLVKSIEISAANRKKCMRYENKTQDTKTREIPTNYTVADNATPFKVTLFDNYTCTRYYPTFPYPSIQSNVANPPPGAANGKKYTYVWLYNVFAQINR